MADNKNGREEQARDEDRRQRERAARTELERMDETEPPVYPSALERVEADLEPVPFPATGTAVVETVGDREIETDEHVYAVRELIPEIDDERFESPAAVSERIKRPTIAAAMKRILEASKQLDGDQLKGSQYDAYEKTFRALTAIDAADDDEGIQAIEDWILERVDEKGTLPGSRAVRRQAASYCRANGYEIRTDEWLGI